MILLTAFLLLAEAVGAMDVASRFGLPAAAVAVLGWWHAQTVRAKDLEIRSLTDARISSLKEKDAALLEKDREIARVQDLRVKESREFTDMMLKRDQDWLRMLSEFSTTLEILAEKMPQQQQRPPQR